MIRWRIPALLLVLAACAAGGPAARSEGAGAAVAAVPATTVLITRHAERADDGTTRDPELSAAGVRRAQALADALANARVDHIITTQYIRTRATAQPLADRLGLPLAVIGAASGEAAAHVEAVRRAVRARPAGGVILVVGHSNTVPLLARALSGLAVPDMEDDEYGTLYIVTLPADAAARIIRAAY